MVPKGALPEGEHDGWVLYYGDHPALGYSGGPSPGEVVDSIIITAGQRMVVRLFFDDKGCVIEAVLEGQANTW